MFHDRDFMIRASILKVWFYVGTTGLLLYFLVGQLLDRLYVTHQREIASYAEKQRFDLVFLALKLPDIPGDELYAKLKKMYPDLPIVIITGYPDSEILTKILSSGPVTVIKKPIEYDQLNRTVKILGHKGASDAA